MNELRPAPNRKRVIAGLAVLVVASAILLPLGVDPVGYFSGVAVGIVVVGGLLVLISRKSRRNR